jgi:hypothetical protein
MKKTFMFKRHTKLLFEENVICNDSPITPGVNFMNNFHKFFCTKFWRQSQNVTRNSCQNITFIQKCACKMMMKLTPDLSLKGEFKGCPECRYLTLKHMELFRQAE